LIAYTYYSGEDPNIQYSNLGIYDHSNDSMISLTTGNNNFYLPVWHPDGNSIFFLSVNREDNRLFDIYSYNMQTNEYGSIYPGSQFSVSNHRLSFSSDGERLAFTDYTESYLHNIFLLDVETGAVTSLDQSFWYWEERHPVISPDGKYLAFLSQRSGLNEIWIKDLNTRLIHQMTGDETIYIDGNLMWSPDSDKIYFKANKDEKIGVYSIGLTL
jgi:Tol biopolymer transport system component